MQIITYPRSLQEAELLMLSGASSLVVDVIRQPITAGAGYGNISGIEERTSIKSIEDIQKVVDCSHRYHGRTYLSVDRESCSHTDMSTVIAILRSTYSLTDMDGIVTCNPALIVALKEEDITLDVILGPEELVLNTETVRFWGDIGVTKIILPSYLTIDEIEKIVEGVGRTDLSVSIFHGHVSSFTSPERCLSEKGCFTPSGATKLDGAFCALCNIPLLIRGGVAAVTVRLSGETGIMNIGLVTLARKLIDMCREGAPEEEITRITREGINCGGLSRHGYLCLATRPSQHQFSP